MTPGSRALDVTFVLLPKFTMLAFSAAIEPLRMANQLTGQVLFRWQVMSGDAAPVACSDGVAVMAEGRWPDAQPEGKASTALGDWLRSLWRRGRTVGSLCTGAYALATSGILKGRRFTTHWNNITAFSGLYPDLPPGASGLLH